MGGVPGSFTWSARPNCRSCKFGDSQISNFNFDEDRDLKIDKRCKCTVTVGETRHNTVTKRMFSSCS
eukprot:518554-Hanusia_phi.AAC.1